MPAAQKKPDQRRADVFDPETQRHLKYVTEQYQRNLRKHPAAARYLMERGVAASAVDDLRLGYACGELLGTLPSRSTAEGKETFALLQNLGLITKSGRELLHGYITVPALDENGVIVQLYGKRITKNGSRPDEVFLLEGPCTINARASGQPRVILAASVLELCALYSAGIPAIFSNDEEIIQKHEPILPLSELLAGRSLEALLADPEELKRVLTGSQQSAERQEIEHAESSDLESVAAKHGLKIQGQRIFSTKGERQYRIDGLFKNTGELTLSVVLEARHLQQAFTDALNILSSKERDRVARRLAERLDCEEQLISCDLESLTRDLRAIHDLILESKEKPEEKRPVYRMSAEEKEEALEFLRQPDLMQRIGADFARCLIVGEEMNLMAGYLAATSRLLDRPVHVLFQSSSASGKTTMMKAVLALMPPEVVLYYTTMTRQSILYMQGRDLSHTICAIEELVGAENAAHTIKMLKSEGRASIAVPVKDPQSGRTETVDIWVYGPISFFTTTADLYIDEEEYNRDLVCAADESREQTGRILELQRLLRTLEGWQLLAEKERTLALHRNAQRLLRPLAVLNPYAKHMTFQENRHRLRRDHEKYQALIETIALLHQYQREIKVVRVAGVEREYVEVLPEDIALANEIAGAVLGRSLDDCPPHTRGFLIQAADLARKRAAELGIDRRDVRLSARELADVSGLSVAMVHKHLGRLRKLDYVFPEKVGKFYQFDIVYALEGQDGTPFLCGLLDPTGLKEASKP